MDDTEENISEDSTTLVDSDSIDIPHLPEQMWELGKNAKLSFAIEYLCARSYRKMLVKGSAPASRVARGRSPKRRSIKLRIETVSY